MAAVDRLVTVLDINDATDDGAIARGVSARHEALLESGRRIVLLNDRGWSGLSGETVESLERTARVVVGPDEPIAGMTHPEMEASHWESLAGVLRVHGVEIEAAKLSELPHEV
jgi:hypothetical protein